MRRTTFVAGTVVFGAVALSACGFGLTGSSSSVSDVSAEVTGRVGNTTSELTQWWFEYGTTTHYDHTTPVAAVNVGGGATAVADRVLAGLDDATTYHYRLCAKGSDEHVTCGADATFTTTSGHDSVTGSGTVLTFDFGVVWGGSANAIGAGPIPGPASGHAAIAPGSVYVKIADAGAVTCLDVARNRAAIGFIADVVDLGQPDPQPIPRVLYVEDNGPTGDRIGFGSLHEPYDTCPAPTDADFPAFNIGGVLVPPVLTSGDFTVHDHPTG